MCYVYFLNNAVQNLQKNLNYIPRCLLLIYPSVLGYVQDHSLNFCSLPKKPQSEAPAQAMNSLGEDLAGTSASLLPFHLNHLVLDGMSQSRLRLPRSNHLTRIAA